jgi:hypothetical protein
MSRPGDRVGAAAVRADRASLTFGGPKMAQRILLGASLGGIVVFNRGFVRSGS